jgi:uncharacterized protein (DUF433 family)
MDMNNKEFGEFRDRIVSNAAVMHGTPVIKGTRVPVAVILGLLASGEAAEDVLRLYPQLTPKDIRACLSFAAHLASHEVYAV